MMTTYRDKHVRQAALSRLPEISKIESPTERYARIIGTVEALLEDDAEMVTAISAAFSGPREKAKELTQAGKAA